MMTKRRSFKENGSKCIHGRSSALKKKKAVIYKHCLLLTESETCKTSHQTLVSFISKPYTDLKHALADFKLQYERQYDVTAVQKSMIFIKIQE